MRVGGFVADSMVEGRIFNVGNHSLRDGLL